MSHISNSEALDLIHKLLTERIPLRTFFISGKGVQVAMPGLVDSLVQGTLAISVSGPPLDNSRGWMSVPLAERFDAWYGDKRELPKEVTDIAAAEGDSVLRFDFADTGDILAVFFTL